jgi:glyceraldehyde-3-phosphate dehydrogenase/erythrose-4-phosphate dehydrogenase
MNNIFQENSNLAGFRIYFGKDNNSNNVAIVVGVNSNGTDAVNNPIYSFVSQNTNACPPVCDSNSPITRN